MSSDWIEKEKLYRNFATKEDVENLKKEISKKTALAIG